MPEALPAFRYHPDPIATGSVVQSEAACECCGVARGYAYAGPTYAVEEVETVCPWCIADGSAADKWSAVFTTTDGAPRDVSDAVLDAVEHRTPGFSGWQQERWLFHCDDAAAYLGRVGWDDVKALPNVADMLLSGGWSADAHPHLRADGDLTGYLFRCLHCDTRLVYADAS